MQNAIPRSMLDKLHISTLTSWASIWAEVPKLMFWNSFDTLGVWCAVGLFLIPLAVTALNFWYTRFSMKTNQSLDVPRRKTKKKKKERRA